MGSLIAARSAGAAECIKTAVPLRDAAGTPRLTRVLAAIEGNRRPLTLPGDGHDTVVVAPPELHTQTYGTAYNAAFSGALRVPVDRIPAPPLDERKLIARRCAFELPLGGVINLGIGMPEVLAAVAAEPGIIGGLPQGGMDFGAAVNTHALLHQNQQFDFYDGGGLDLACLGMAQTDRAGNVNVSRFGARLAGAGGFINISQNARRLVFAGTFTAGGLKVAIEDGALRIVAEGRTT